MNDYAIMQGFYIYGWVLLEYRWRQTSESSVRLNQTYPSLELIWFVGLSFGIQIVTHRW